MCMGEICQVVGRESGGRVRVRGEHREQVVTLLTLEKSAEVGDWLIVHSGFALGWLDPAEAAEATALRATPPLPPSSPLNPAPAAPAPARTPTGEPHPSMSSTEASP
jgi:hydrogenase expression/formation protein HypC